MAAGVRGGGGHLTISPGEGGPLAATRAPRLPAQGAGTTRP